MPSQRVVDVVILVNSRAFRNQSSMLDVFCLTKFYANTQGKSMKAGGVSANRLRRSKVFRRASQAFPDGMFQILPVHCWWLVLAQIELRARPRVDPSCSLRTSVFIPATLLHCAQRQTADISLMSVIQNHITLTIFSLQRFMLQTLMLFDLPKRAYTETGSR